MELPLPATAAPEPDEEQAGDEGPAPAAPQDPPEGAPAPAVEPGAPTQQVRLQMAAPKLGSSSSTSAARSRQIGQLYTAIGTRSTGIDLILVAGVDSGNLHLQLFHPSTQAFSRSMEIPYQGDADDEAAQTVPLLLNRVDGAGNISQTSPIAAPLDIGANSELALLLTQPTEMLVTAVDTGKKPKGRDGLVNEDDEQDGKGKGKGKGKGGLILGIVGGVVAAGAVGGGVYLATQAGGGPGTDGNPNQGSIIVQF